MYGARRSHSDTRCCHCLRGEAVRQCRQPALNMVVECLTIAETHGIEIYSARIDAITTSTRSNCPIIWRRVSMLAAVACRKCGWSSSSGQT